MSAPFVLSLQNIISNIPGSEEVGNEFLRQAKVGCVTRDENPLVHFCVYFAGFDPENKEVFIGHHIKSGLWLFNGGHIDKGEMPRQAVKREIGEEWGISSLPSLIPEPSLLTITQIEHPEKVICEVHYNIWYFIPLNKETFAPDEKRMAKEFHVWGWKTMGEARTLIRVPNTLTALGKIEEACKK